MAKKQARPAAEPEVLEAESQDQALIATDGNVIATFMRNMGAFFKQAAIIERDAKALLAKARTLNPPTNGTEDLAIQVFIRQVNTEKKSAEAHWGICQAFSSVHRKLTAARGRTTSLQEEAAAIAQRLHNAYADQERRRAAEEQERRRREEEAKAREARDRELAAQEQRALDLEAASDELSERERRFVDYITGPYQDPQRAAQQAGYKDPNIGFRLLQTAKIEAAIEAIKEAKRVREQAQALRQQPIDVRVDEEKPDIQRAGGGFDRSTHAAEVLDLAVFRAAVINGGHGIPWDVLTVDQTKLNEYARSLQERINAWPGVRHKKTTKTV